MLVKSTASLRRRLFQKVAVLMVSRSVLITFLLACIPASVYFYISIGFQHFFISTLLAEAISTNSETQTGQLVDGGLWPAKQIPCKWRFVSRQQQIITRQVAWGICSMCVVFVTKWGPVWILLSQLISSSFYFSFFKHFRLWWKRVYSQFLFQTICSGIFLSCTRDRIHTQLRLY